MHRIQTRPRQRGNVLIEFALSSTLLVFLLLGTFQFGYAFYQYNSLVNAVRSGVRYASMAKISNQGNGTLSADYIDSIRKTVVYGSPVATQEDTPVVRGLAPSDVEVEVGFDGKFVPQIVTVRVTRFTVDAIVRNFTINGKPSLQMPFLGQYCPVGC